MIHSISGRSCLRLRSRCRCGQVAGASIAWHCAFGFTFRLKLKLLRSESLLPRLYRYQVERLPWSSSVVRIVKFLLAAYFSDNSQAFDDSAQQVALDAGSTRLRCLRVFLCKFPLLTGACSCWMCRWSVHANWPRLLHMLGFDQGNSY